MEKLLPVIWVSIATAVLCTTNAAPVENHQMLLKNLNDYSNFDAFSTVHAYRYKSQDGAVTEYNTDINGTYNSNFYMAIFPQLNASLVYSLDFGTSETATSMSLGLAAAYPPGVITVINVYVDSLSSTPILTMKLTDTGYPFEYTFISFTTKVSKVPNGIHDVFFIFTPLSQTYFCYFDWFQFHH